MKMPRQAIVNAGGDCVSRESVGNQLGVNWKSVATECLGEIFSTASNN